MGGHLKSAMCKTIVFHFTESCFECKMFGLQREARNIHPFRRLSRVRLLAVANELTNIAIY